MERHWFNLHGIWFDSAGPIEELDEEIVRQALLDAKGLDELFPDTPISNVERMPFYRAESNHGVKKVTLFPEAFAEKPKTKELYFPEDLQNTVPAFYTVNANDEFIGLTLCLGGRWGSGYYFLACTEEQVWPFEYGQWNTYKEKEEPEEYFERHITTIGDVSYFEVPAAHKYTSSTSYYPDVYYTGLYSGYDDDVIYEDPKYYRCDSDLDPYPRKAGAALHRRHTSGGITNRPGRTFIITDMDAYHDYTIDDNIAPQATIRDWHNYYEDEDESQIRCFWLVYDEALGDINVCSNMMYAVQQVVDAWDDEDYAYNCLNGIHHGGDFIFNLDAMQVEQGSSEYSYVTWGSFDGDSLNDGSFILRTESHNHRTGPYYEGYYEDWDQFAAGEFSRKNEEVINENNSAWSYKLEVQGTQHTLFSGVGDYDNVIERDYVHLRIYKAGEYYITLCSFYREDEEKWEYHMVSPPNMKQISDEDAQYEWVGTGPTANNDAHIKAHKLPLQVEGGDVFGTGHFAMVRIVEKGEGYTIEVPDYS